MTGTFASRVSKSAYLHRPQSIRVSFSVVIVLIVNKDSFFFFFFKWALVDAQAHSSLLPEWL